MDAFVRLEHSSSVAISMLCSLRSNALGLQTQCSRTLKAMLLGSKLNALSA